MSVISASSGASIWRQNLLPSAPSTRDPASPAASDGGAGAQSPLQAKLPDPRSALQKSLNQGLQDYMQKLRVNLNRPAPRQSSEADAMQKAILKQRVEGLRRMMMMAHDKASLRALAAELGRLARALKELVSSMTQNAADSQMAVSVGEGGAQASSDAATPGGGAEGADNAASAAASTDSGGAAADAAGGMPSGADAAATAPAAGGESAAQQQAAGGQDAANAAGQSADAAAKEQGGNGQPAGGSQAVDAGAALHSMLSSGKGNPVSKDQDIQEMLLTLKMVKEFIKQQAQQLKDKRETQDKLQTQDEIKGAEKALEDVDKILKGGPEAEEAMGGQISVNISDAASGVNVSA
ncbi:hypothetical protein J9978_02460 [Chromobacterium violaceum]|uniref:hypothetical protein n=1 Tax=Chromobacterium violaceum TaxID=536 RepID=UPI001B326249|nr:hypothetical protein [Chromobacterium violaceum]MBP4048362.1 hypothetical protein [Chromobacterium violaceum]